VIVVIDYSYGTYYTDAENVERVVTKINDGEPVRCFWYSGSGKRYEEEFTFYGDPQYIRSESA
jgi:hypothetical protein